MEVILQPQKKKKLNWKKLSIWIISIILVLGIAGYFAANAYIARSLPKTSGEIKLSGLNAKVQVIRDENGVPHINAENEHDLFMAQGYIQAQDRLFQMDLSRRQASGELSEVIGEATLNNDKYFRTLGLRRAAEESYNNYSNEGKDTLQWFADGVNAYIKELRSNGKWPIEFTLLGYKPRDWTPIDSLTIGKYMAFDLGGHWEDQAFRYFLLQNFPKDKAYDLFPSYPKDAPYIVSKDVLNLEKSFASAVIPHEFNGSNNWVVSGEKTKSGKPILADDPHLALNTPSIWYQMHLKTSNVNVSGVIFAGIPGIILGHNEEIAWGVTNTGPDVQDLYIEKRNPEDKDQFLYNKKWEKAQVIHEPIKVKKQKTIDYKITVTRHGPIISEFAADSGKDTVLSLQWTALQPSNELEAVLNMNKAKNWNEFEKALENFQTPAQNFVFAAKDGTIAYKANGKIPIRKKGTGMLPVPGWTSEYEWTGYIPFKELPKSVNPKEGFLSSANNKVVNDQYPYHISNDWAQPYRQMRIQEVLKTSNQITAKDMRHLQMDKMNLQAKEFVPIFLEQLKGVTDKTEKEAFEQLKNWNYVDDQELAAPLIFNFWMRKIPEVLFQKEISDEMLGKFGGQKQVVDQLLRHAAAGNPGPWISENGGLQKVLQKSLSLAIKEIKDLQGNQVSKWEWGKYHQLLFAHPLSKVKPLYYLFNSEGKIPVGGSSVTVQAAANYADGTVYHGASWRFVIDTSDMNTGYHLVGPGQSGHVKSKWYHDQLEAWAKGKYHETKLTTKEGETLTLSP